MIKFEITSMTSGTCIHLNEKEDSISFFFFIHVTSYACVFGATALKEDPTPKDKSVLHKDWERKREKWEENMPLFTRCTNFLRAPRNVDQ